MSKLFVECERCEGAGNDIAATSLIGQLKDCPDCKRGFIPYKPPEDVQALAGELFGSAVAWASTHIGQKYDPLLEDQQERTTRHAAHIAAFCEKQASGMNDLKGQLQTNLNDMEVIEKERDEYAVDNERLRLLTVSLRAENKRLREQVAYAYDQGYLQDKDAQTDGS